MSVDRLLDRLDALGGGAGRLVAVLIVPPALIDPVTARIRGPGTRILVAPSGRNLDDALAELLDPFALRVEGGNAANRRRLVELSAEAGRIARALASMSFEMAEPARADKRAIARLHRLRGQHFISELLADLSWDIRLDLAAARMDGRLVAVASLCIAAAVPAITALLRIAQVTEQAFLERRPDPRDGRRVFIHLSDAANGGMEAYLQAATAVVTLAG